jgi:hypothetical protein
MDWYPISEGKPEMDQTERDKLYDWLENGKVDVWLRRLMRERLDELEHFVRAHRDGPQGQWAEQLLHYERPTKRHGGWVEALNELRKT